MDIDFTQPAFILAQIFGFLGMVFMIVSFQLNQKQKLLKWQIWSCAMYVVQYLCLGALSGGLMNLVALIRNYLYSKLKTIPKPLIFTILIIVILLGIIFYQGPISLLPIAATCLFTIGLTSKNLTLIRLTDVISCLFYIIYNINVAAYVGLVATILELTFTLIAMIRLDFRGKKRKN